MKIKQNTNGIKVLTVVFAVSVLFLMPAPAPAAGSQPVTVDNFVRAESDTMILANMKAFGVDFGQFAHLREPTTPETSPSSV